MIKLWGNNPAIELACYYVLVEVSFPDPKGLSSIMLKRKKTWKRVVFTVGIHQSLQQRSILKRWERKKVTHQNTNTLTENLLSMIHYFWSRSQQSLRSYLFSLPKSVNMAVQLLFLLGYFVSYSIKHQLWILNFWYVLTACASLKIFISCVLFLNCIFTLF